MLIGPHLIVLCIALLFAVLALVPSWPGHSLLAVAVILAIIAQFIPK